MKLSEKQVEIPKDILDELDEDGYVRRVEIWKQPDGKLHIKRAIWERD